MYKWMDPEFGMQIELQGYHDPLDRSLLTSEAIWRKLKREGCVEEELDCVLCWCP